MKRKSQKKNRRNKEFFAEKEQLSEKIEEFIRATEQVKTKTSQAEISTAT